MRNLFVPFSEWMSRVVVANALPSSKAGAPAAVPRPPQLFDIARFFGTGRFFDGALGFGAMLGLGAALGCSPASYKSVPDDVQTKAPALLVIEPPTFHQFRPLSESDRTNWTAHAGPIAHDIDGDLAKRYAAAPPEKKFSLAVERAARWLEFAKMLEKATAQGMKNEIRGYTVAHGIFAAAYRKAALSDVPPKFSESWSQCAESAKTPEEKAWCEALKAEVTSFTEEHVDWLLECDASSYGAPTAPTSPPTASAEQGTVQCPGGEQLKCKPASQATLMRACLAPDAVKAAWLDSYAWHAGEAGDTKASLAMHRAALELMPGYFGSMNNIAWTLATSPDDAVRNAQQALPLADYLAKFAPEASYLDTAAAVYAELGDFGRAVKLEKKALALVEPEKRGAYEAALARYQRGEPTRD